MLWLRCHSYPHIQLLFPTYRSGYGLTGGVEICYFRPMELVVGFEPTAYGLQIRGASTAPHQHIC